MSMAYFGISGCVILPICRFLASVSQGDMECSLLASELLQLLLGLELVGALSIFVK